MLAVVGVMITMLFVVSLWRGEGWGGRWWWWLVFVFTSAHSLTHSQYNSTLWQQYYILQFIIQIQKLLFFFLLRANFNVDMYALFMCFIIVKSKTKYSLCLMNVIKNCMIEILCALLLLL